LPPELSVKVNWARSVPLRWIASPQASSGARTTSNGIFSVTAVAEADVMANRPDATTASKMIKRRNMISLLSLCGGSL
jgi:hypothetical protein